MKLYTGGVVPQAGHWTVIMECVTVPLVRHPSNGAKLNCEGA